MGRITLDGSVFGYPRCGMVAPLPNETGAGRPPKEGTSARSNFEQKPTTCGVRSLLRRMNPVDEVGGEGRIGDLHWFRRQPRDTVEEPFSPSEKDWHDVKHQLA